MAEQWYAEPDESWSTRGAVVPLYPDYGDVPLPREAAEDPRQSIVISRPTTFGDARTIAEHLREGRSVLIDMSDTEFAVARRIVDFTAGVVMGTGARLNSVAHGVLLAVPPGIAVAGAGDPPTRAILTVRR